MSPFEVYRTNEVILYISKSPMSRITPCDATIVLSIAAACLLARFSSDASFLMPLLSVLLPSQGLASLAVVSLI